MTSHGPVDDAASQTRETVFERSKTTQPNWMKRAPGQFFELGQDLQMLTVRSRLINLTLGLRQTEVAALDETKLALATRIQSQLADFTPSSSPALRQRWHRMVLDSTAKVAASTVKVRDIYFEGISRETVDSHDRIQQYYRVAVLVGLPKDTISAIYQDLARQLASLPEAEWQRLASGLQQVMSMDKK